MRPLRRSDAATRLLAGAALALLLLAAGGLVWAAWYEPYRRLGLDRIELPVLTGERGGFRIVHLADLHVTAGRRAEAAALERLAARVAERRPGLIAISGDLWDDDRDAARNADNVEAAAAFAAVLGRFAPVVAVQGHSDHLGDGVARLAAAGVRWLHNESLPIDTPAGPFLLVGLSQQAGHDELVRELRRDRPRFAPHAPPEGGPARELWGATHSGRPANVYVHYDPAAAGRAAPGNGETAPARSDRSRLPSAPDPHLAAADGALAWRGYDATVEVRLSAADTGAGLVVHSRQPLGEDRMVRLRRVAPGGGGDGSFVLVAHGTAFTAAQPDTGVVPEPGRWYRLRLATRVEGGALGVAAKAWPADQPEPAGWHAWGEDRSPSAPVAGTVGLWAWGGGTVLYRDLAVAGAGGALLYASPLTPAGDAADPPGWRAGARGSRLTLALAKAPPMPAETPRIVLAHSPDATPEAAWRGVEAVLAGHTHGGQIALPGQGALTTRSALGRHYDAGTFHFAAFNRRGWTTLYVNPGFGTSLLPLRFAAPPRLAVVELLPRVE
jgi:predicted MPP superfamily phosphohydrolase